MTLVFTLITVWLLNVEPYERAKASQVQSLIRSKLVNNGKLGFFVKLEGRHTYESIVRPKLNKALSKPRPCAKVTR